MAPITRPRLIQDRPRGIQRGASLRKNDRDARTYSERVEAGGSAHGRVMQRTLYNNVIPHIMAQSRAESRQRCVTITGCVQDHNCVTMTSCVTITSCVYAHKLRMWKIWGFSGIFVQISGIFVQNSGIFGDFVLKKGLPYKLLTVNCSNFFMLEFKISTF